MKADSMTGANFFIQNGFYTKVVRQSLDVNSKMIFSLQTLLYLLSCNKNIPNPEAMKDLKKYYRIKASPEEVYAALTNPFSIELWTGEKAEMSTVPGEEFSLYSGDISGKNLQFEPGRKIIQEWFFGDQEQPSVVTITLQEAGYHTKISLHHTNIPDEAFEDMDEGWDTSYFGALKEFFE